MCICRWDLRDDGEDPPVPCEAEDADCQDQDRVPEGESKPSNCIQELRVSDSWDGANINEGQLGGSLHLDLSGVGLSITGLRMGLQLKHLLPRIQSLWQEG